MVSTTSKSFDWRGYVGQYDERLLRHPRGRVALTRDDPLLFALIYFSHHLRSDTTGGQISFSQFHLDLAESAKQWARKDLQPAQVREAWVAPRESGKSTWLFGILPTWALAHGHRKFISAYAGKGELAEQHLSTFKRELDTNQLLRSDYPDLCAPARRPAGTSVADKQALYLAKSGAIFQARGIDTMNLGTKVGNQRPDLLLLDDVERDEGNYSIYQKDQRLKTILQAIFPMNINAVVEFAGTTTMYGSIMHDLVNAGMGKEAPEWVQDEGIVTRYYPAIVTLPDDSETSLWPERWPLAYLQSIRKQRSFALNYMNQPVGADGSFWSQEDFTYESLPAVTHRLLSIDPAVTSNSTSDYTGLAIVGYDATSQRCSVEYAAAVKLTPGHLRARVVHLLEQNPGVKAVLVETNQGGDTWKEILGPLPVKIATIHQHEPKPVRFAKVLDYFQSGWVVLDKPLPQFEGQALAYPNVANDDIIDAVCSGVHLFLKDRKRPKVESTSFNYAA